MLQEILFTIQEKWQEIAASPEQSALVVLNLILIEILLSVDNAAVIATMVMDLPPKQQPLALRYGIFGAYLFRGLAMIFVSLLISIWWLKPLGGIVLLYLCRDYFKTKKTKTKKDDKLNKQEKWYYQLTVGIFGKLCSTIIAIEIMDMGFSLDNIFAAVSYTDNILLICMGVFIGILGIRFVAQLFVRLMKKYPFLEISAFVVIGVLGFKMVATLACHFGYWKILETETGDILTSILTGSCFFAPVIVFELQKYLEKKI
jgi:YkoY family integral membrane protein